MVKMASDYNVKRLYVGHRNRMWWKLWHKPSDKRKKCFIFTLYTQEMGIEGIKGRCYLNVRIMVSLFA